MTIQTPDRYDALIAAIEEYGRACYVGINATPARKALNKAIDDWAAERDAKIRAEEREACVLIAGAFPTPKQLTHDERLVAQQMSIDIAAAIRTRATEPARSEGREAMAAAIQNAWAELSARDMDMDEARHLIDAALNAALPGEALRSGEDAKQGDA